jgi:hypothetical protein
MPHASFPRSTDLHEKVMDLLFILAGCSLLWLGIFLFRWRLYGGSLPYASTGIFAASLSLTGLGIYIIRSAFRRLLPPPRRRSPDS